ncbi:unnamed protein product [Euphydryas editha]|uniref:Uncharacterized protein n=1 Tax=Euphydryas editha TaxID=104508 RepID=A0AAU9UAC2_EUPED|nr:unnamed protein product [Euphydryas editha]
MLTQTLGKKLKLGQATDNDDSNYQTFFLSEQLLANSRACPQRFACWTGRESKEDTEAMQTWEKVMSNKLLATMLNTTALKEATLKGKKGHNCESYAPCPIEERSLPRILKNFAILTNYK